MHLWIEMLHDLLPVIRDAWAGQASGREGYFGGIVYREIGYTVEQRQQVAQPGVSGTR